MAPENSLRGVAWQKSSYSGNGGNCIEIAMRPGAVAVRDSKNPDGGLLMFSAAKWAAFLADVRRIRMARS